MTCWHQKGRYTLTSRGSYSVSHSYQALLGTLPKNAGSWFNMECSNANQAMDYSLVGIPIKAAHKGKVSTSKHSHCTNQCCLCEDQKETQLHLFVRNRLSIWLGITIQCKGMYSTVQLIKRKRFPQVQKKILASVWGQWSTTRGSQGIPEFLSRRVYSQNMLLHKYRRKYAKEYTCYIVQKRAHRYQKLI